MMATEKILSFTLAAALLSCAGAAFAEGDGNGKTRPPQPKKRFSICLWPNPCGRTGVPSKLPPPPKEKQGEKKEAAPKGVQKVDLQDLRIYSVPDPLSKIILQDRIQGRDGVVSAVRLKPEFSGWKKEQILYRGEGSLSLPTGILEADGRAKNGGTGPRWDAIGQETLAADQVNGMREHQGELSKGSVESRDGLDKMWGKK